MNYSCWWIYIPWFTVRFFLLLLFFCPMPNRWRNYSILYRCISKYLIFPLHDCARSTAMQISVADVSRRRVYSELLFNKRSGGFGFFVVFFCCCCLFSSLLLELTEVGQSFYAILSSYPRCVSPAQAASSCVSPAIAYYADAYLYVYIHYIYIYTFARCICLGRVFWLNFSNSHTKQQLNVAWVRSRKWDEVIPLGIVSSRCVNAHWYNQIKAVEGTMRWPASQPASHFRANFPRRAKDGCV